MGGGGGEGGWTLRGGGGGLGGGGGRGCGGGGGGGGEGSGGGEGGGEPSVSQVKVRCSGRVPARGGSRAQSQRGRVPSEARGLAVFAPLRAQPKLSQQIHRCCWRRSVTDVSV